MVEKDIKKKTIFGMIWTAAEKFGSMAMSFVSNLVLARLLLPEDFGVIGMLHIFIAISGAFMVGGFGDAIIQKKGATHTDFSTVFMWNMVLSIFFYIIIFFASPAIARFYKMPSLCEVMRVYGLVLILVALSVVQNAILRKELKFKILSIRNLVASFCGLVVGVVMAYLGFGAWSLVASALVNQLMNVVLIWRLSSWRPSLVFDKNSFKELFSFGGMLMLTSLIDKIYANLQGLLIGKWYSADELGYYTQARKLETVPTHTMSYIVTSVSFPVFAKLKDDKKKLLYGLRKNIKAITYLNFPLCMLLLVIAKPLIEILYGAKWDASVPYFQLLCLSGMLYTMNALNGNIVKALGKGKLFFIIHIVQRVVGLLLMIAGIGFSVKGLLAAVCLSQFINYVIYSVANGKLLNYGIWQQFKDVFQSLLLSVFVGVAAFFTGYYLPWHPYLVMIIQIIVYIGLFWGISKLLKFDGYITYRDVVKQFIFHK